MDTHKNAPLTPKGREAMVRSVIEGRLTKAAAALQFNVSAKTVANWIRRFRAEGVAAASSAFRSTTLGSNCQSAFKFGSDSLLMQFGECLAL
ncbi:helix-turn-helix domain-containing protein [Bradyrhizobium sp. USDA 4529]